jgi:hypothetical protein
MSTTIHEFPAGGLADAKRCVVLGLDTCSLLLAQTEVLALESALDIRPTTGQQRNVTGSLPLAGQTCSVYSLDRDLNCLTMLPRQHRICAVLQHPQGPYAVSCSEVRMIERSAFTVHPLPRAFTALSGPVRELVVMDGRLLLGTNAAALLAHLGQRRDAEVVAFEARSPKART